MDLPPGDYTITLKKEGYRDAEEKVSLWEGPIIMNIVLGRSGGVTVQTTTAVPTSSPTPTTPIPAPTKATWPIAALILAFVVTGQLLYTRRQP